MSTLDVTDEVPSEEPNITTTVEDVPEESTNKVADEPAEEEPASEESAPVEVATNEVEETVEEPAASETAEEPAVAS